MTNYNLTQHFTLFEMVNAQMPKKCIDLNWQFITDKDIANLKLIAEEMENLRIYVNEPLIIKSGFRCLEWEKYRGRSGNSQHRYGLAVDVSCSNLDKIYNYYKAQNWLGGLGDGRHLGFVHVDLRKPDSFQIKKNCGARWSY